MPAGRLNRWAWDARYRIGPRAGSVARQALTETFNRHAAVDFGRRCRLGPGFTLDVAGPGRFRAGDDVDFRRGFVCEIGVSGSVDIGDRCAFTYGVVLQCSTSLVIGDDATFAMGVLIVDGSHRFRDHRVPMRQQGFDHRPITIGAGAGVMAKASVFADIGAGAFVGAGAVVTRPVPHHCLAVGVPARVVEYFGPPEDRPAGLELGTPP